ncbi:YMR178W [Zygosaccharomyces parabailii]|nr:YMR178W [Zygosaccharomyces parabailii]CDH12839.1 related to 3^-phosphoadenosine 5^-phosphosulfate sulfotransferase (PAPS reductase)/FAD synthetase and related enzymes [Zygosaccharomyces bailii ISA1307]
MNRLTRATSQLSPVFRMPKISAACMIIGDEVLNGKIIDTNSRFFAKYCWETGINLREIVTVGDDEKQIVETLQGLTKKYEFIVTSGGIGPTHDDITYESIAKSFGMPTRIDEECKKRMQRISNPESRLDPESLKNFYRMATFPYGGNVKNYYVADDLWVPICSVDNKVYILPGIPQLFTRMIKQFTPTLRKIYGLQEDTREYVRFFVKTHFSESQISQFLRKLQEEAAEVSEDIKIGSYPHFGMGFNTVSILGTKEHENYLKKLSDMTIEKLDGEPVAAELEEKYSNVQS